MTHNSANKFNWPDTELTRAVAESRSWRGAMRELGLTATSAGSLRVVKRRDAALKRAAADAYSWDELLTAMRVKGRSGDERIRVKAQTLRLGLDLSHPTAKLRRPSILPP